MKKKLIDILYKGFMAAGFAFLGYSISDLLLNYRDNMQTCGNEFTAIDIRLKNLENPKE